MKLKIVLRTCSTGSITKGQNRIVDGSRSAMILKCTDSLIKSANRVDDVSIVVLDDHSDSDFLVGLEQVLSQSKHPVELRHLEERGFNHSAIQQFAEGCTSDGFVYFVEDDYFHSVDAIESMLSIYSCEELQRHIGFNALAVHPYDCPHRYWPTLTDPTKLFYHDNRYWRTITNTTNTLMIHSGVLRTFYHVFDALARHYPTVKENDTINRLYSNLVTHGGPIACVSPIPSVAYHVSYENEAPNDLNTSFTNWKKEWQDYEWNKNQSGIRTNTH